jgi:Tfp pilus assembly protein PilW
MTNSIDSTSSTTWRGDRGSSIIEIIIAVVLIGTVVVAILTAVISATTASTTSRSSAQVETALVNATDRVNRAPKNCDYTVYAQAAVLTQHWDAEQASVTQQYYVPAATSATAGTWVTGPPTQSGCPTLNSSADGLVQRVTITITSTDGHVRRSIQVVKSDV